MMKKNLEYRRISTPIGLCSIVGNWKEVLDIRLNVLRQKAFAGRGASPGGTNGAITKILPQIKRYFSGDRVRFVFKSSLWWATPFEKRVYRALMRVPYGKTISYGELARRAGNPGAARAVGRAMARNRLPILIPCHRVISADGSIGGFSAGVARKITLLRLENHVRLL